MARHFFPSMHIVGLDCATQPRKTGLALATLDGSGLAVHEARTLAPREDAARTIADWLAASPRALLALDAPLGWPAPMGEALAEHRAGGSLAPTPDAMFSRETDHVVWRATGKKPLEVGAGWLARTAHAALSVLARVRQHVEVEMGWTPGDVRARQALEVYPASVLISRGLSGAGYKRPSGTAERRAILNGLAVDLPESVRQPAIATDHVLDAILCCVAAMDYARGDVLTPEAVGVDAATAHREGWIWFRQPAA